MANTKQNWCFYRNFVSCCFVWAIFVLLAFCLYVMVSVFVILSGACVRVCLWMCVGTCMFLVGFFLFFMNSVFLVWFAHLFSKEKKKGHGPGYTGKWRGFGEESILYEKYFFSIITKQNKTHTLWKLPGHFSSSWIILDLPLLFGLQQSSWLCYWTGVCPGQGCVCGL